MTQEKPKAVIFDLDYTIADLGNEYCKKMFLYKYNNVAFRHCEDHYGQDVIFIVLSELADTPNLRYFVDRFLLQDTDLSSKIFYLKPTNCTLTDAQFKADKFVDLSHYFDIQAVYDDKIESLEAMGELNNYYTVYGYASVSCNEYTSSGTDKKLYEIYELERENPELFKKTFTSTKKYTPRSYGMQSEICTTTYDKKVKRNKPLIFNCKFYQVKNVGTNKPVVIDEVCNS